MRKLLSAIVISVALLLNMSAAYAGNTASNIVYGEAQLASGTIKAAYDSYSGKKLKLMVEKNGKRIYYNLRNDGAAESFPLQFGNGDYKVSIMENMEGSQYKFVSTANIKLSMEDQNDVYLASIQNVNWDEDMAAIKKAGELTKGLTSDKEKVKAVYDYIVNNIEYDYDKLGSLTYNYLPDIDSTLKTNSGICYDFASTFAAMLRSAGVPTKLVKGYSDKVSGYHAWNEVYDSETDTWQTIDTTFDSQMENANLKYNMIKNRSEYTKVNEY